MADKDKRGRVTPKKGSGPAGSGPEPTRRRLSAPKRIGPFDKPDPDAPLGQVGRRPSNPGKLALFALMYLACGIASFVLLSGSLAVIVGVVFIGLSLLWMRGAATAYLRQRG